VVREAVASSFMRRLRISSSELSLLSSFHLSSAPSLSFPSFSFFSSFPCFRSPSALLVWKKAELQGKTSETNYAQKAMMSLFLTHLFFGITKARYNIVTCDMLKRACRYRTVLITRTPYSYLCKTACPTYTCVGLRVRVTSLSSQ
jgi:hypothetical protein